MASARASGVVAGEKGETADEEWTTSIQTVTSEKPYLWNYEVVLYTDTDSVPTDPVILGNYAKDGKGISAINEYYCITSGTTCSTPSEAVLNSTGAAGDNASPDTWYTTTPLTTPSYRYLWNCEKISYTDGSIEIFTPALIGTHGEKGSTVEIAYAYRLHTSSSLPADYYPKNNAAADETNWMPEPSGVTAQTPYEFVSQNKVTDGKYGNWSTPKVWAKYGSDASVNRVNTFNALTNNGTNEGIYYADSSGTKVDPGTPGAELYINASMIKTGSLEVRDNLKTVFSADVGGTSVLIGGFEVKATGENSGYIARGQSSYLGTGQGGAGVYLGTNGIGLGNGAFYVKSDGSGKFTGAVEATSFKVTGTVEGVATSADLAAVSKTASGAAQVANDAKTTAVGANTLLQGWKAEDVSDDTLGIMTGNTITSGMINASKISVKAIKSAKCGTVDSNTGFTTAGTLFNLEEGSIHTPGFSVTQNGNAKFKGAIEATSLTITAKVAATAGLSTQDYADSQADAAKTAAINAASDDATLKANNAISVIEGKGYQTSSQVKTEISESKIRTDQIEVRDLEAFGATIAKWQITSDGIVSPDGAFGLWNNNTGKTATSLVDNRQSAIRMSAGAHLIATTERHLVEDVPYVEDSNVDPIIITLKYPCYEIVDIIPDDDEFYIERVEIDSTNKKQIKLYYQYMQEDMDVDFQITYRREDYAFQFLEDGSIYASAMKIEGKADILSSGSLAGWNYDQQGLWTDNFSAGTGIGLWSTTNHANIAIHAGATTSNIGSAPFRVYHDGTVCSSGEREGSLCDIKMKNGELFINGTSTELKLSGSQYTATGTDGIYQDEGDLRMLSLPWCSYYYYKRAGDTSYTQIGGLTSTGSGYGSPSSAAANNRLTMVGTWYSAGNFVTAAGGSTSSDMNKKYAIENLPDVYSTLFDNLQPVIYKYNDGSSGRYHTGFIAQPTLEAVEQAGLTSQDFAGVVIENRGEENESWYLRYGEFVALNTNEIQKLKRRASLLENENQKLKEALSALLDGDYSAMRAWLKEESYNDNN